MKSYLLIPTCLVLAFSCKKDPPVVPEPTLSLTAVDASCIEAWLKVTTTQRPATVRLLRDGQRVSDLRPLTSDSLLVDEGLLPNRAYTYQLQRLAADSTVTETSASVQVTTMDTTSHAWLFDPPVLLGDGSSSVLYDVAIINDTLVYAVGEIYKRDSLGNWDPNACNLVKWNGREWQLERVYTYSACNPVNYAPLKALWAFSDTSILVTSGGSLGWYNGRTNVPDCSIRPLATGSINKIWATSERDIYVVGGNGFIAHYNGTTWRRLESGIGVRLNDVWGGNNPWVGGNVVLVAASNKFDPGEMKLLRIRSGVVDNLPWPMQSRRIHSVWFDRQSSVYTSGGGVFRLKGGGVWSEQPVPLIYTDCIRGSLPNSIWVAGDFGIMAHFNGYSWRDFLELRVSGIYYSVAVTDNMVFAVGYVGARAVIQRGVRQGSDYRVSGMN